MLIEATRSSVTVRDLRALTSLRFFAAGMIVLHHTAGLFPWGGWAGAFPLSHGVSFFFVLSGFILTHVYTHRRVTYRTFLFSRFARIWPVHFVTLLAVYLLIDPDYAQYGGHGFFNKGLVFAANMLLLHSVVPFEAYVFSWNGVSWTISTEAFFYAAFPLLLVSIARNGVAMLLVSGLIVVAIMLVLHWSGLPYRTGVHELSTLFLTYSFPLFRGFEFVLGMVSYGLWASWDRRPRPVAIDTMAEILAVLVVCIWFVFYVNVLRVAIPADSVLVLWLPSASCLAFALLIPAMASGRGPIGRLLSLPLPVWLGEISFALYMTHVIVFKYLFLAARNSGTEPFGPVAAFGLCLLIAALTHHVIEQPARRFLLRQPRRVRARTHLPPTRQTARDITHPTDHPAHPQTLTAGKTPPPTP